MEINVIVENEEKNLKFSDITNWRTRFVKICDTENEEVFDAVISRNNDKVSILPLNLIQGHWDNYPISSKRLKIIRVYENAEIKLS